MNKPFIFLLIPFTLGILISYYYTIGNSILFIFLIFTIMALVYNIIKNPLNQRVILLLLFLFGIFIGQNGLRSNLVYYIDSRMDFSGTIHEVVTRDKGFERYIISVDYVDSKSIAKEKMVLNLSGNKYFQLGERVDFDGVLKLPKENTNPKLFNYRLNLMTDKIYTAMSIKEHSIRGSDGKDIGLGYRIKAGFTSSVEEVFNTYLNEDNAGLMTGIFLGQSSYLRDEDVDTYRDMGLAHILAVSGLHIGIISGFIYFILSNIGVKSRINVIITLLAIWIYGYLIGFPPSILRASLMFSVLYLSKLVHEPYDSINSLCFAMFVLLLINPYYLFNVGFQLSFAATFSIIIFSQRIRHRWYPYGQTKLIGSLATILGVQIGLLPFQAYYFNVINPLSIIANLLIIPIMSIGLVLGFMMIVFMYLPLINPLIGFILDSILDFVGWIIGGLQGLSIDRIKIFSPDIITIFIFYIILFIMFGKIDLSKLDKSIVKTISIYLIILTLVNTYTIANNDLVELHFIDVGQGDSILIRTKRADYLMDTGGSFFGDYNIAEGITLAYLNKLGVHSLDGLFITHFDADHSQGVPLFLDELDIAYIFSSYMPDDEIILDSISSSGVQHVIVSEGNQLKLDEDVYFHILWPSQGGYYEGNNGSLVGVLKTKGTNLLLTGDIEKEAEYLLSDRIPYPIDIIKVPHHGSSTSSSEIFLESVSPRDAIISVGRDNLYNHPSSEVIDRYLDHGINIYRTDKDGLIKVIIDDDGYLIQAYIND